LVDAVGAAGSVCAAIAAVLLGIVEPGWRRPKLERELQEPFKTKTELLDGAEADAAWIQVLLSNRQRRIRRRAHRVTHVIHLHSTGLVLDPNGHVIASVYSSGAIGRIVPGDVTGLLDYLKSKRPA
jgi:hypothetical protein